MNTTHTPHHVGPLLFELAQMISQLPNSTAYRRDDLPAPGTLLRLTPREREVLALMARGRSNAGIAAELVLSDSAVAKHINAVFTKLDIPPHHAHNRRVLAILAYLHAESPTTLR